MTDILDYKGYIASIHFSSADEVFYGKLLGINDLVSFEGDTVPKLKRAFHEAVDDYLETCKELGKEPDKVYRGTFNVRISADLHRKAAMFAALHRITLNDYVRQAIDFCIEKESGENKKVARV